MLLGLLNVCSAASFLITGTAVFDSDVRIINLVLNNNGVIDIRSVGYGGWTALAVPSGGFATSLSLYDVSGNQVASDFVGGTAVGPGCSNGAQQDAGTGFCEDAVISFNGLAGSYTLALSTQVNNGPALFSDGFPLPPNTNLSPGPFADPGDPTGLTIRNGNWGLLIDLDGSADVPEPGTLAIVGLGTAILLASIRRQKN
jgi:hypothetical protein